MFLNLKILEKPFEMSSNDTKVPTPVILAGKDFVMPSTWTGEAWGARCLRFHPSNASTYCARWHFNSTRSKTEEERQLIMAFMAYSIHILPIIFLSFFSLAFLLMPFRNLLLASIRLYCFSCRREGSSERELMSGNHSYHFAFRRRETTAEKLLF